MIFDDQKRKLNKQQNELQPPPSQPPIPLPLPSTSATYFPPQIYNNQNYSTTTPTPYNLINNPFVGLSNLIKNPSLTTHSIPSSKINDNKNLKRYHPHHNHHHHHHQDNYDIHHNQRNNQRSRSRSRSPIDRNSSITSNSSSSLNKIKEETNNNNNNNKNLKTKPLDLYDKYRSDFITQNNLQSSLQIPITQQTTTKYKT
jgi:hypothetical protein